MALEQKLESLNTNDLKCRFNKTDLKQFLVLQEAEALLTNVQAVSALKVLQKVFDCERPAPSTADIAALAEKGKVDKAFLTSHFDSHILNFPSMRNLGRSHPKMIYLKAIMTGERASDELLTRLAEVLKHPGFIKAFALEEVQ